MGITMSIKQVTSPQGRFRITNPGEWAGRKHAVRWFLVLPTRWVQCGNSHECQTWWCTSRWTPCLPERSMKTQQSVLLSETMTFMMQFPETSSDRPVGSTQRSGACTGHRAAEHVFRPGKSWRTRRRAGPARLEHSSPEGPSGSGYPKRKITERLLPETLEVALLCHYISCSV